MHHYCPLCGITLRLQGVSIAYTRWFCWKCNRTFEVINPHIPNWDAREGKARVSYVDVMNGRMMRDG